MVDAAGVVDVAIFIAIAVIVVVVTPVAVAVLMLSSLRSSLLPLPYHYTASLSSSLPSLQSRLSLPSTSMMSRDQVPDGGGYKARLDAALDSVSDFFQAAANTDTVL